MVVGDIKNQIKPWVNKLKSN